jgi:hypothetical protein
MTVGNEKFPYPNTSLRLASDALSCALPRVPHFGSSIQSDASSSSSSSSPQGNGARIKCCAPQEVILLSSWLVLTTLLPEFSNLHCVCETMTCPIEEDDEAEEEAAGDNSRKAACAAMDKARSHSRVQETTSKMPGSPLPATPLAMSRRNRSHPRPAPIGFVEEEEACCAKDTAIATMSDGERATSRGRGRAGWRMRDAATRAG